MSLEMAMRIGAAKGFHIDFVAEGKSTAVRLTHPDYPGLAIQVWLPCFSTQKPPPQFVKTILSIYPLPIAIDFQDLSRQYRSLARLGIHLTPMGPESRAQKRELHRLIRDSLCGGGEPDEEIGQRYAAIEESLSKQFLDMARNACEQDEFEEFLETHLPLLPLKQYAKWKRHLSWVLGNRASSILNYIYQNVAKWKKECGEKTGIYIPRPAYSLEYLQGGKLRMFFTYHPPGITEIQNLVIDLDTGKCLHSVRFSEEEGAKISKFQPLLEQHLGLLHFAEFYSRDEGVRGFCKMGNYELFDTNLWAYFIHCAEKRAKIARLRWRLIAKRTHLLVKRELSVLKRQLRCFEFSENQKEKIAFQLLNGLIVLQGEKIAHLGIYPSSILLRHARNQEIEAVIGNYQSAYFLEELPKRIPFSQKYGGRVPKPFQGKSPKNPFSIPIYQLGHCFRLLFGPNPPKTVEAMIDGMCQENEALRWSANLALAQLCQNHESTFLS